MLAGAGTEALEALPTEDSPAFDICCQLSISLRHVMVSPLSRNVTSLSVGPWLPFPRDPSGGVWRCSKTGRLRLAGACLSRGSMRSRPILSCLSPLSPAYRLLPRRGGGSSDAPAALNRNPDPRILWTPLDCSSRRRGSFPIGTCSTFA